MDKEELCDQNENRYKVIQYQYAADNNAKNESIKFLYKTNEYTYNYDGTQTYDTYRIEYADYDEDGNCILEKNYGNMARNLQK